MTAPRCIQTFRHAEGQTKHVNNFTFFCNSLTGKTLPGPGLHFCCDFQVIETKFGVNNMKAWIFSAFYQWLMLLVV